MYLICKDDLITIRVLEKTKTDMDYLLKWLNNKNVSDFYGDSRLYTIDEIKEKYDKKIDDKYLTPCIIEYKNTPVGYIQFYPVNSEIYDISNDILEKIVSPSDKTIAIDLFIGDDNYRDIGLGTKTIKLLLNKLFADKSIKNILIDPITSNKRAINCYKKCGFKEVCIIKAREERNKIKYDNLIMKIENYNIGDK